jgi:class 3 adenylate cyclase
VRALRRAARDRHLRVYPSAAAAASTDCAAVGDIPETRYGKTGDGAHIAFQVLGDGPLDLVFLAEGASHLDLAWDIPAYERVFRRLASFSRLIRFDTRGSGLSDPLGLSEQPSLEEQAKDMLAVLDAAGAERAAVVANSVSGLLAIFFAASYPDRTSSLVLDGCYARLARAPDYPWGVPREILERAVAGHEGAGLSEQALMYTAPSAMKDPEFVAQRERLGRSINGPAAQRKTAEMLAFSDVRPVLTAIQAPTLVLYRRGDRFAGKPHAIYLAEHIAGTRLVELPGEDNLIYVGNSDADLDEIEELLTGARHASGTNRVLATVLFTDMVGSTEHAAELGDRKWRDLLDAHDRTIRRQLERFRGREVNTAGDGFLATFDGPGRAIQCGCAIRDAVRALGIEIRAGLHTGEIELRGDDVAGVAVHIGARVAHLADAAEVLVSSTVKDLVAGSGIEFVDRGEHELKGVPGTWRLFSVVS